MIKKVSPKAAVCQCLSFPPGRDANKVMEKANGHTSMLYNQLPHWVPVTKPMRSVLLLCCFSEEKIEAFSKPRRKVKQSPWNMAEMS